MKQQQLGWYSCSYYKYATYAWLAWILVAAEKRLIHFFPNPDTPLNADAYLVYLPSARKFLDQPWSFLFQDPSSYHVAPLGYVWAAIWGADPAVIQLANCVLFFACILMLWRSATQLGGLTAGFVTTGLLVYNPQLISYIPQVLTESIYLFGIVLLIFSVTEYIFNKNTHRIQLGLAAAGLSITLLSRPVLQIFTLIALACSTVAMCLMIWHSPSAGSTLEKFSRIFNRRLCLTLVLALTIPAAVVVKNGVFFDFWGISTGAGTGLYYGVNPFKQGMEPAYSGFNYDAGIIPLAVDPKTEGNPLSLASDRINTRIAFEIVWQTTLADNVVFFAKKLKSWIFFSTPELLTYPKLRKIRIFEWLSIILATLKILSNTFQSRTKIKQELSATRNKEWEKLIFFTTTLLITLSMALQLTPVLYNARYNLFFIEPWLILLTGVSSAILLQQSVTSKKSPAINLLQKSLVVLALIFLAHQLTSYAKKNETWRMDPYRPGPTAVILNAESMDPIQAINATSLSANLWRLDSEKSSLALPLRVRSPEAIAPKIITDAIWRIRLSVSVPNNSVSCRRFSLAVSPSHTSKNWPKSELILKLHTDAKMHTYAIHGNGQMRPSSDSKLLINFQCPVGTTVNWVGAELLESTLAEKARAFIMHGSPIDPYLRNDPTWQLPKNH